MTPAAVQRFLEDIAWDPGPHTDMICFHYHLFVGAGEGFSYLYENAPNPALSVEYETIRNEVMRPLMRLAKRG